MARFISHENKISSIHAHGARSARFFQWFWHFGACILSTSFATPQGSRDLGTHLTHCKLSLTLVFSYLECLASSNAQMVTWCGLLHIKTGIRGHGQSCITQGHSQHVAAIPDLLTCLQCSCKGWCRLARACYYYGVQPKDWVKMDGTMNFLWKLPQKFSTDYTYILISVTWLKLT